MLNFIVQAQNSLRNAQGTVMKRQLDTNKNSKEYNARYAEIVHLRCTILNQRIQALIVLVDLIKEMYEADSKLVDLDKEKQTGAF